MSNYVRLRVLGEHTSSKQAVQHRFFYSSSDGGGFNAGSQSELASLFSSLVLALMVNSLNSTIIYRQIEVIDDVTKVAVVHNVPLVEGQGVLAFPMLPQFTVAKVKLQRANYPVVSGRKMLSGITEAWINDTGGFINPVEKAAFNSNMSNMALVINSVLNPPEQFFPVLLTKYLSATGTFTNVSTILEARFVSTSTQKSRQRKSVLI